jgi:hypothetical protein
MTQNKRKHQQREPQRNSPPANSEVNKDHSAKGYRARQDSEEAGAPEGPRGSASWTSYQRYSLILSTFTFLLLIPYTFATFQMWRRMEDSAVREERFFRLAHRARLGNVHVDRLYPGELEVRASYSNDPGGLPAEHVAAQSVTELITPADSPPPEEVTFPPSRLGVTPEIVVGPGSSAAIRYPTGQKLSEAIDAIKDGRYRMYYLGRITYTDALKTKGLLEFCFFYNLSTNDWSYCAEHNVVE